MRGPDIATIRAGLLNRVSELADYLAPHGVVMKGVTRWSLNPTRNDKSAGSFKIDISGATRGRWYEFLGNYGGDLIDLIAYCLYGGEGSYQSREARSAAIKWAVSWLGLEGADPKQLKEAAKLAKVRDDDIEKHKHKEDVRKKMRSKQAAKDWFDTPTLAFEHEVSRNYLINVRGLDPDDMGAVPKGLRFEPDGPKDEYFAQHDKQTGEVYPAIITCAVNGKGKIKAVHRTFLMPDGSGKAPIDRAKRMYGSPKGTALRLSKGDSKLSPEEATRREITGEVLAISEGIEDGLSWACIEPGHRVWAAGSLELIASIPIHACISKIILLGQNDPKGSEAEKAFERVSSILMNRFGNPVEVLRPADPAIKDWNDLWRKS